jgi:hypothetical protein
MIFPRDAFVRSSSGWLNPNGQKKGGLLCSPPFFRPIRLPRTLLSPSINPIINLPAWDAARKGEALPPPVTPSGIFEQGNYQYSGGTRMVLFTKYSSTPSGGKSV